MSNGRRFHGHSRQHGKSAIERYGEMMLASGMDEREVARGVYYAQRYGLAALSGGDDNACVVFDEPTCGDWNCINPEHQRLKMTA